MNDNEEDVPEGELEKDWFRTSPRYLNIRVQSILRGISDHYAEEASDIIAHLFRSGFEIEPCTRDLLADALDRARKKERDEKGRSRRVKHVNGFGDEVPYLELNGFGLQGELNKGEAVRRAWLDAAEWFHESMRNGIGRGKALGDASDKFSVSVRKMEDALAFWDSYQLAVRTRDALLFERTVGLYCEEDDEDFPMMLKESFLEIETEKQFGLDPSDWRDAGEYSDEDFEPRPA